MRFRTAVDLLNQVTYKPGWVLTADSGWLGSEIVINVEAWVADSSDAPRYMRRSLAGDSFTIDLTQIDESDHLTFLRAVLDSLIAWETHEAREFFRFGEGRTAPFHPHKASGRGLFEDTDSAKLTITSPIDHKYQLVSSDY